MSNHASANISHGNLQTGARLVFVGMVVNVVLATVKITAGILGRSYVLIADGIESALDVGGSAIIWGGLKFAARPPDATHPYGHGKAEPVAAIAVSLGVIGAAVLLAIESVMKILEPHHAPPKLYTLIILVLVVASKETLFRITYRLGTIAGSTAIKTDAWHHRSDALTSIAAFIGISLALLVPRWASADSWAALFACALIAANGWQLFNPALHEVLDTAPQGRINEGVRGVAANVPGVVLVEQCRVRKMGLDFYVDLHVGVDGNISVRQGHELAHRVKDAIRRSNPRIADVLVHVEPAAETR